jgi:GAF domain-containing protein
MSMSQVDTQTQADGQRKEGGWLTYTEAAPEYARRARLAAVLLVVFEALTLGALTVNLIGAARRPGTPLMTPTTFAGLGLAALWAVLFIINRRGWAASAGTILSFVLLAVSLVLVDRTGPFAPTTALLILPIVAAGLFGSPLSAVLITLLAAVSYLGINLRADSSYVARVLAGGRTAQTLYVYANVAMVGFVAWLFARLMQDVSAERDEIHLALVTQRQSLESRLVRNQQHLQATISVARAIAGSRDLDHLLEDTVRLVRETFGYYHVQIFLVDEGTQYAMLRQSTGEAGQRMLTSGHQLAVGSTSVIGQVTLRGEPVLARDTDIDPIHRRNELLPNTRSEMALPLSIGGHVIGALDLQSVEPDAFAEDVIPTLQALADQLAVAIQNARLYEQAEYNLREMRQLSGEIVHRSWAEFLSESPEMERRQVVGPEPPALRNIRSRIVERVLSRGRMIVSSGQDGVPAFIAVPIVVHGEVVGVIGVEPDEQREWTQRDREVMEDIAERTAAAVDNARLYLQARRAAERERLVGDIAERLQRAPNLKLLLESAAHELASALRTDNVYAEISLKHPLARQPQQVRDSRAEAIDAGQGDSASPDPVEETGARE